MKDTTWIMSPWPVVPWGLRKALNWVRGLSHCLFVLQTGVFQASLSLHHDALCPAAVTLTLKSTIVVYS